METYQAPTPPPNPYDFITNPQTPPKKPSLISGSFQKRLIFVIGGAVILIILAMVVMSLLGASSNSATSSLKALVADQEEIIRIAELGVKDGSSSTTRAFATTTALSVETQQKDFIAYLEQKDTKVSKEELAAERDSQVDENLEEAKTNNRFDEVFVETLSRKLATYSNQLESTYNDSSNETAKNILKASFASTSALIGSEEE